MPRLRDSNGAGEIISSGIQRLTFPYLLMTPVQTRLHLSTNNLRGFTYEF